MQRWLMEYEIVAGSEAVSSPSSWNGYSAVPFDGGEGTHPKVGKTNVAASSEVVEIDNKDEKFTMIAMQT